MKPESKGQRQKRCQNEKTDPRMPKKVGDRLRKKIISLFLDETEGDQSKEGSQEGEKTEIWLFLQQPQQEKTENQDEGKRRRSRRESQPVGKSGILNSFQRSWKKPDQRQRDGSLGQISIFQGRR